MTEHGQKRKAACRVLSQQEIAAGIYDLRLENAFGCDARPGQFVGVFPPGETMLLPRPVSLCDADASALRMVYRVAGKGTDALSRLEEGATVDVLGMLGNGFPLEEAAGKRVLLAGGGIGIPPMLFAAKRLSSMTGGGAADASATLTEEGSAERHSSSVGGALSDAPASLTIVCGYRDAETFLSEELAACGELLIATDDGSAGVKGTVIDALDASGVKADVIFACGPKPMLRAIAEYGRTCRTFLSLEERMACGVGVCLGCVCPTRETDSHSRVHNARVCTEGPVFAAEEVLL
ncbi:MAG: dihydroorotate dehydrogenase electron transfer subunit [Lachnospiraceae bacterium]|nr:dihydroorotate dehydrogenase electron transfer subunit [Lachnospiraceae bacterium]